ncbi:MAG TPA: hypothetical protein VM656_09110 [Pyrinomonadaceae bacterium]|nr:hypothetical protein [Pyrinomonadaceae bacterium]
MRKIPTLFRRDSDDMRHVLPEVTSGCEWVLAGEGYATRKYDGTCVMFDGTRWWARREVKWNKDLPIGFIEVHDETTEKIVGWEPAAQSPFAKFIVEAAGDFQEWSAGTYELCGPKVNGNPERFLKHILVSHDDAECIKPFSLTWEGIWDTVVFLHNEYGYEGLVWHHPESRSKMAKIKARDFR